MPVRWKLTLWFALVLLVILILSGTILHIMLQNYLFEQVDYHIGSHTARIHGTLSLQEISEPVNPIIIHASLPRVNEFASPGIYIQLTDRNGNVVVKSENLGELELPVDPALISLGLSGGTAIKTVAAGGETKVRIMVSPLYTGNQTLVLEVAQSLNLVDTAMSRLRLGLLASIFFALALATVSGGFIVRKALAPVKKITNTARDIEAGTDLKRRVDYHGPADEIGELAKTFDHMLSHLERVFQSQKDFVADASHELRGPLTVFRGNLDMLKRQISEDDRRESLQAIERETLRMSKIVNDLLLLAELEAGQVLRHEEVTLKSILTEEADRAKSIAGKRMIITSQLDDLMVKGDSQRLKQLVGNLLDNAVKYTSESDTITISLAKEGNLARLEVADTGIGIAPEHLSHIFDRFYRVDKARSRAGGRTGLGLAIVKGIAEQHGGKVSVVSHYGKGSIFTVRLPINLRP